MPTSRFLIEALIIVGDVAFICRVTRYSVRKVSIENISVPQDNPLVMDDKLTHVDEMPSLVSFVLLKIVSVTLPTIQFTSCCFRFSFAVVL